MMRSLHVLIYLLLIIISVKVSDLSRGVRRAHGTIRIGAPLGPASLQLAAVRGEAARLSRPGHWADFSLVHDPLV